MSEFKKGDRVRLINAAYLPPTIGASVNKGDLATVMTDSLNACPVSCEPDMAIGVIFDHIPKDPKYMFERRFELVKEERTSEFKEGDVVIWNNFRNVGHRIFNNFKVGDLAIVKKIAPMSGLLHIDSATIDDTGVVTGSNGIKNWIVNPSCFKLFERPKKQLWKKDNWVNNHAISSVKVTLTPVFDKSWGNETRCPNCNSRGYQPLMGPAEFECGGKCE
jgi:hypothetical protein